MARGAAATVVAAAAIDAIVGEPPPTVHPVVWMGRAIELADPVTRIGSRRRQFVSGGALVLCGACAWFLGGRFIERGLGRGSLSALVVPWLLKTCLSWKALDAAAAVVEDALRQNDIVRARLALRSLVSRDVSALDEGQIAMAAIESVAENFSDSLVAPTFAYLVAGLGGALAYRWINTCDAMIGYRGIYEWSGKAAARLDDLANLLPARAAAVTLLLASGRRAAAGYGVLRRDRRETESINAGWPMSVAAGVLCRSLEKPGHYRLNPTAPSPDADDIREARRLVVRGWLIWLAISCVALAARTFHSSRALRPGNSPVG